MKISEIGDALRIAREEKGMTQRELAKELGLTQPFVSLVETGAVERMHSFLARPARKEKKS